MDDEIYCDTVSMQSVRIVIENLEEAIRGKVSAEFIRTRSQKLALVLMIHKVC